MLELSESLLSQYQNKSFWIDDNDTMGVILHNEPLSKIKEMLVRFKYSKYGLDEETGEYRFNLIEFVKLALTKGYDWKLFGREPWDSYHTNKKKKKKFIKPRVKTREEKIPTPYELVQKAILKHMGPSHTFEVLDEMAKTIALVPDQLKREIYVKQLSDEFNFDYQVLKNQVAIKRKLNKNGSSRL